MNIRAKPTEKSKNSKNTGWNTEEKKKSIVSDPEMPSKLLLIMFRRKRLQD
jgi:hypothetical protein